MPEENLNIAQYVEQTAQLIDLPLAPEYRLSVVENFAKIAAIATLLVEFPLPEDVESAPVFEP
jgi:hypothetical protein